MFLVGVCKMCVFWCVDMCMSKRQQTGGGWLHIAFCMALVGSGIGCILPVLYILHKGLQQSSMRCNTIIVKNIYLVLTTTTFSKGDKSLQAM